MWNIDNMQNEVCCHSEMGRLYRGYEWMSRVVWEAVQQHTFDSVNVIAAKCSRHWWHNIFKRSHQEVVKVHLYSNPASSSQNQESLIHFTEWPLSSVPTLFRISTFSMCWIYVDYSSIRSIRILKVSVTVRHITSAL